MMEKYEFSETNSMPVEENGEQFRKVYFRGIDPARELDVNGHIPKVPVTEYFQAGIDGTIDDLIRTFVVDKLTVSTA
ncbi:hypothetical protein CIL05_06740 [Virgibacillus profundi]|uniref:Uncharacterized protein n=1 Tax=Virgibacillus profundi TaxID=2024555 RepID=A0A2A2IFL7_9BACI|nr:hypothetical protein [Virgibacillus profundi]PAV30158.1 hypothetical protein CIL05_06740 [Virgibacillus profundi]PXY54330.1 hypothetical protein CIT14_06825 [Virgibacillus profundi]